MPKIEISTSDHDFNEEAYKKALDIAKNEIDNMKAELEKLYQTNQMLRVANEEMKKYIDTHQTAERQETPQKTAEKPFDDCYEDCDGIHCQICEIAEEHTVPDDDAVDIEIDHLIRENLDLEGRLKGMEDALHIALAWIKYGSTEGAENEC